MLPTFVLFVDRRAPFQHGYRARKGGRLLAVHLVRRADLDGREVIEHVQPRQGGAADAVHAHAVARGDGIEPAAAARPARGRAELGRGALAAEDIAGLVRQLRRHRTEADARHVGLVDADHALDLRRADADADRRAGRERRGRGGRHVGVGAGIEVEQAPLRALQQHLLAGVQGVEHDGGCVSHVGPQLAAPLLARLVQLIDVQGRGVVEALQHPVLPGQDVLQPRAQRLRLDQVRHADALARHLIDEGRPDAALGRVQGAGAPLLLLQLVEQQVVGHEHLGAVAHEEVLRADLTRLELLDLIEQGLRVDDDAVADQADLLRVEDPGRHQVQGELAHVVDDRMAGVISG